MASSSSSPCAACKFLRRKCTAECVFSPYFPPDQPQKFANVHKIFGASNISKLLQELPPSQRDDAVNSLAYEADARVKDPVYGCVGAISILQRQVDQLQRQLAMARQDLARYVGSSLAANSSLTQQSLPSSIRIGTGLHQALPGISRDHIFARDQLMGVTREQQLISREQWLEIARIGGGSYEAGLAALGLNVSLRSPGPPFSSRQASDSGEGSCGSGMRHLSP